MKNKSRLLLLPASLLLLTGCGSSASTSIPRTYAPVDKTDATARNAFFEKVAKDIATTYEKGVEGFTAEGSFSLKEFSLTQIKDKGTDSVKITNLKADYKFGLVGLNEGSSKAKAMFKLENAGFKLDVQEDGKQYTLSANDIDVAAYFVENTLYFDLSDKDVKTFVNDAIDYDYNIDGHANQKEEIAKEKEEIGKYLGKYFVKDNEKVEEVASDIPKALTSTEIAKIKTIIAGAIEMVLADEKAKDLLTLAEDKNSQGAAIGIALTSEPVTVEDTTVSGDMAASLVFNKEGLFARFGFAGNVDIVTAFDNPKDATIKLSNLDFGASFKYGANSVKLPNFSDYKQLEIPTIKAK